jgi:hypothetical protein
MIRQRNERDLYLVVGNFAKPAGSRSMPVAAL